MSNKNWIIVYQSYEGLQQKAVNRISSALYPWRKAVTPTLPIDSCPQKKLQENNVVFVGLRTHTVINELCVRCGISVPQSAQSYALKVCKSPYCEQNQIIVIAGYDEAGVLYGAVDFVNKYIGEGMHEHNKCFVAMDKFFALPFQDEMPEFSLTGAPSFARRALWTWGHCIYDYKNYFENMATLKLNTVVIWNDYVPVNAKQIVAYAHSLGIEVYFGYSWGWFDKNEMDGNIADDSVIAQWSKRILDTYQTQYENSGADGIYFQSFTETDSATRDGVCIASAVTKWVNTIGGALLAKYPDLKLQFGLHATSVKDKLDVIATVDKRICIIWEDCGSFPYAYHPNDTKNQAATQEFNQKICALRGKDEPCGMVFKGMVTLDWMGFAYQTGSYVLGECGREFIAERTAKKQRLWKYLQSYWIQNADFVRQNFAQIQKLTKGSAVMQLLVEDGCFEEQIFYPVAIAAEMLWNTDATANQILGQTARFPNVKFAN